MQNKLIETHETNKHADAKASSACIVIRDDVLKKIEIAHNMISALCKPRGSEGSREWTMSIPA